MAAAGDLLDQDLFTCSVCQDLLKDPVTIPCGHSYCMGCIKVCWDQYDHTGVYRCPQCRQIFRPRPVLGRNTILTEVVEKLKTGLQAAPPAHCYAGPGDVACDFCTGRKRKAVKSCLVCLASYCETHLQPHYEYPALKKHKLVQATGNLQEKICSHHNKLLEVYCRTDQQCICYLCTMDEHRGHDTVSAAAERAEKQKQLGVTQREFQQRIQEREKELQDLRQAVLTCSEMEETEGPLMRLEQEIADLRRRDAELEQLSHTEDHIHFLQSCQSLCAPPGCGDLPSITVDPHVSFVFVKKSVSEQSGRQEDVGKGELNKISQTGSSESTLNTDTGNHHLSEGNREVTGETETHPEVSVSAISTGFTATGPAAVGLPLSTQTPVQSSSLHSSCEENRKSAEPSPETRSDAYEMKDDRTRGYCLVISNQHFTNSIICLKNRHGTEVDEKNLKQVFDWLGFETQIQRDCSVQRMLSLMEELSRKDHSGMDCLVVCVLSHGDRGLVHGVDGNKVNLEQLTGPFSGDRCPSLVGKPKLFFIQTSQGMKVQRPVHIVADKMNITDCIPAETDFLLGMATMPGYVSFRDKIKGTWFIQSLCQNLLEMVPRGYDLLDILTEVNNHVSHMTDSSGTRKQMPLSQFALRKSVVFPVPKKPPPNLQAKSSGYHGSSLKAGNPLKKSIHEDLYKQNCAAETEEEEMTIFYRALSSGSKEFFKLVQSRSPNLIAKLGSQFVEEHRAELIERVTSPQLIADALHDKKMIHSELYSQITAAVTSQEKMRLLYRALQAAMDMVASFCEKLQEMEPYLLKDLVQSSSLYSSCEENRKSAEPSPETRSDAYEMKDDRTRGYCLVISNQHFTQSLANRHGTEVDEENLKQVFDWLGFETQIQRDCSVQRMLSLMEELSRKDHSGMECLVVCVLSHGDRDRVYGGDGEMVNLEQLTGPFLGDRCPSLVGKPKLFFIQTSQGMKVQRPVHIVADKMNITDSIPAETDFLLGMATMPDFTSFRDKIKGTWFIQSLCQNLLEMVPRGYDLLDILTEVNNHVSHMTDPSGTRKQMPLSQFALRKGVVFPVPKKPPPNLQAKSSGSHGSSLKAMAGVPYLLISTLDELTAEELKRFCWNLTNDVPEGFSPIPKGQLENRDVPDTVDQMLDSYGEERAVRVTLHVLNKTGQNHLAQRLEKNYKPEASGSTVSSVSALNTEPAPNTEAACAPDPTHRTEFTPETNISNDTITYRLQCTSAGQFQCSLTGLVFGMERKGEVLYNVTHWDSSLLTPTGHQPAGPLFNITCPERSLCELQLPHCEVLSEGRCDFLSVAHVIGDSVEILTPLEVTDTHVRISVSNLSNFGLIKSFFSSPVHGQVLLFLRPPGGDRKVLNVLLLPGNVPFSEVLHQQRDLWGNQPIQTSPECDMTPGVEYSLTCPPLEVQPQRKEFFCNYGPNYYPAFEVFVGKGVQEVDLRLVACGFWGSEVWRRRVSLKEEKMGDPGVKTGEMVSHSAGMTHMKKADDEDLYKQICAAGTEEKMTILYRALSSGSKEFFKLLQSRNHNLFQKLGAQFVEKHRDKLIEKVTAPMSVAEPLRSENMVHRELWSQIEAARTSHDKMRLLYKALDSAAKIRATFFKLLLESESYLLEDLAQQQLDKISISAPKA